MKTMKVLPNPFSAFDAERVPCGVCPRDPDSDGGGPGMYVGAQVDDKKTEILQHLSAWDDLRSPMQRTFFSFLGISALDPELGEKLAKKTPIEVPATRYYRARVREGALVACDKATAESVGLKFVAPERALCRVRKHQKVEPKEEPVLESGTPEKNIPVAEPTKKETSNKRKS